MCFVYINTWLLYLFVLLDISSLDVELMESVGDLSCALEEILINSGPSTLSEESK